MQPVSCWNSNIEANDLAPPTRHGSVERGAHRRCAPHCVALSFIDPLNKMLLKLAAAHDCISKHIASACVLLVNNQSLTLNVKIKTANDAQ